MRTKNADVSFDIKQVGEQGVVVGILNHFDNKDHANDVTLKGAFHKSLSAIKESGRDLVVLWQHDPTKPIGVWKNLRETEVGLEGEAHLNLDVALAREAYALVKQGAVTGFSIGYYVVDEEYDRKTNTNYLKEVQLQETSLVTFPCNDLSRTREIKMKLKGGKLPTADELKSYLVTSGLGESDAERICAKYMPNYVDPEEQERLKAEAQAQVDALIKEFGLKYESVDEEAEAEETTDDVKSEDEPEDEPEDKADEDVEDEIEEKSNSMDLFFR